MPIKPARRLPRKFNRPISERSRSLVHRREEHRARLRKERYRRLWRKFQRGFESSLSALRRWMLWLIIGLVVLATGIAIFSPILDTQEIRIIRHNERLNREQVQTLLSDLFGRHMLFITAQDIKGRLQNAMPDIQSIVIDKEYPSTLVVDVTLEPLFARLHIDDPLANSARPASDPASGTGSVGFDYITEGGVYVSYPGIERTDLILIRLVDWGARPVTGSPLVTTEFLEAMQKAEHALVSQFGQDVVARTIYLRAQEFHLSIPSYRLWFDVASPVEEQLGRYRAFLRAEGTDPVTEYIDLRLSERVVYK